MKRDDNASKKNKNLLFHLLIGREHESENSSNANNINKNVNIKKIKSEHVKKFYFNKQ